MSSFPTDPQNARKRAKARTFDANRLRQLVDDYDEGYAARAARRIGIAQPTMSNLLAGKYAPQAETLDMIARAYGVTVDYILGKAEKLPDDTFDSGVRYAMRHLTRELARLDTLLTEREIGPRGIAAAVRKVPEPTTGYDEGDLPPVSTPIPGVPKAAGPGDRAATPKKKGKKRRA